MLLTGSTSKEFYFCWFEFYCSSLNVTWCGNIVLDEFESDSLYNGEHSSEYYKWREKMWHWLYEYYGVEGSRADSLVIKRIKFDGFDFSVDDSTDIECPKIINHHGTHQGSE